MELDTIELGDAYELIKKIPDKSIDLICTDPPYLYDDIKWFSFTSDGILHEREGSLGSAIKQDNLKNGIREEMLDEWVRVLKKINVFVFCNKNQIYGYLDYFVKRHNCMFEILIWAKKNPVPLANGAYMHDKEYCLNFWEKGAKRTIKSIKEGKTVYFTISTQKETKDYGHPTIKPLEMVEELVKIGALEGGVVLDPFMGSGTTAIACKNLNRNFLGFEKNPKWRKVALDRLKGLALCQNTKDFEQQTLFDFF